MTELEEAPACSVCGWRSWALTHGWCKTCYNRWIKYGRPESGPPPPPTLDAAVADWRAIPVTPVANEVTKKATGTAAEFLVCADLLLQGYQAFPSDRGGIPYDVVVDCGQLIRIQVKSTREPRALWRKTCGPVYQFTTKRHSGQTYAEAGVELLALVGLDIRQIAYIPPSLQRQATVIHLPGQAGRQFADYPFAKALAELGLA